jgi:hypothetical protein
MCRIITEELIVRELEPFTAATDASNDEKTLFKLCMHDRPLKEDESAAKRACPSPHSKQPPAIIRCPGVQFPLYERGKSTIERRIANPGRPSLSDRQGTLLRTERHFLQRTSTDEGR